MLAKLLLSALLGAQTAFGALIFQESTGPQTELEPESPRWHYTDCTSPDGLVELQDISLDPDPPKAGESLAVTGEGNVKATLEEGLYADVLIKVGVIKLLQKRFDVCEEARNANATVQCPVEPGHYKITQSVDLPKEIPPAAFTVALRVFTNEDAEALCLNLWMDFRPHPGGVRLW